MRTTRSGCATLLLFALCASSAAAQVRTPTRGVPAGRLAVAPQTQTHTITGIEAWSLARANGFEFRPAARSEQWVTYPYDGVDTRLQAARFQGILGVGTTDTITLARIVGGNLIVDRPTSGSRSVTFVLFGGRRLADGWAVEEVRLRGGGRWKKRPEGSDLQIEVEATAYANRPASVGIESVTLVGPAGQPWSAAFQGRKTFTITGIEAWATAKSYGFEFHPMVEHEGEYVTGGVDGTDTQLRQRKDNPACNERVQGRVVGGVMILECVAFTGYDDGLLDLGDYDTTRDFRMFGGKELAPGWTVREVDAAGGSWVDRPEPGARSLEFRYRLTLMTADYAFQQKPRTAHITRIVLEGPASASSWEDAFKVN